MTRNDAIALLLSATTVGAIVWARQYSRTSLRRDVAANTTTSTRPADSRVGKRFRCTGECYVYADPSRAGYALYSSFSGPFGTFITDFLFVSEAPNGFTRVRETVPPPGSTVVPDRDVFILTSALEPLDRTAPA